jgi:hypothetical protein
MARRLKVYRTPIGFHDAYVAAASQKEALRLWGSEADLFARGQAEFVTDGTLTREPLARPGEVVRRARGNAAEHLAALPPDAPDPAEPVRTISKPRPPRPSRAALGRAERALREAEARHEAALADLRRREAVLQQERRALDEASEPELARLRVEIERLRDDYEDALAKLRA